MHVAGRGLARMGGGGSKQAQLERYGQLLTPGERQALELTFHEISGSHEASFFTEKQLTVSTIQPDVHRWTDTPCRHT